MALAGMAAACLTGGDTYTYHARFLLMLPPLAYAAEGRHATMRSKFQRWAWRARP